MKPLRSTIFIVAISLFLLHQLLQKVFHVELGLVDKYLDPLLAMPVILTLLLGEHQWLFKKGLQYRLSPLLIAITTFYISLVTEVIFPLFSRNFNGDWIDVACYTAGSVLFHFTVNRSSDGET